MMVLDSIFTSYDYNKKSFGNKSHIRYIGVVVLSRVVIRIDKRDYVC